jgi:hypothetical protein
MADHPPRSTLLLKESLAREEDVMNTIEAFIERHTVATYFALAFAGTR